MRRPACLFAALALLAAPAAAQLAKGSGGGKMSQEQAQAALLGVDMQGYSPTYRIEWRECVQPDGKTLYETPDGVKNGRLVIDVHGQACFAYEDDAFQSWGCYRVENASRGFIFSDEYGSLFITTSVKRGVKSCKPSDDLIG
jgi:hypothetical protein